MISRILACALIVAASLSQPKVGAVPPTNSASDLPKTFVYDASVLREHKAELDTGYERLRPTLEKLIEQANAALAVEPVSVMEKEQTPPSGDKHDYMSIARYAWPNPDTPDGLPYIRKDGQVSPAVRTITDYSGKNLVLRTVETLSLAYYFTGDERYSEHAAKMLDAWFVHPETRMNPNLKFAQAWPGVSDGRLWGIIETAQFSLLPDYLGLLEGSPHWAGRVEAGMRRWLADYHAWMTESEFGQGAAAATNNHGTWYDSQVAAISLYLGNREQAVRTLEMARKRRIAAHIEPDGSQPEELKRTKSWDYSIYNLQAMVRLAEIGRSAGVDLWGYESEDGRSIPKAIDFLLPYAFDHEGWPYQQIKGMGNGGLIEILRVAAVACDSDGYRQALQQLNDEIDPKARRNLTHAAPDYSEPTFQTVMLPMRDGTHLATDVYLPEGVGSWPVILARTPYGREAAREREAEATADGYAIVVQDVRGRFDSEGENLPFLSDGWGENQDGYDTIAWIYSQPWCDGNIGTWGGSALGIAQNLLAPTNPPGLKCQFIAVATSSLYHHAAYQGGALRESQVFGWTADDNGFDPKTLDLFLAHPDYDEFWQQFNIAEVIGEIQAPAVHLGGWFDTFSQGTIDSYALRQHAGGEGAMGNQLLVMGPWTHSGNGSREQGELVFPEQAAFPPVDLQSQWLEHWLKGANNGIMDGPAVTYYTMGDVDDAAAPGNEWRYAEDWPVDANETPLYLRDGGMLAIRQFAAEEPDIFVYDPADPVPTVGGRNLVLPAGPFDQRGIEQRDDVLVYSTEPLNFALEVTGRVKCRLWASCDAVDTDICVRLNDVYPDGRSILIADGILRLSHRNGFETSEPLVPGEIYEVEVDLWSTSIVFNEGHQVRISLSGGSYPRWEINPGTGEAWGEGCELYAQTTTVYHDEQRPSAIVLPVPVTNMP